MIGSCTLFVKKLDQTYDAHIMGGCVFDYMIVQVAKKKQQTIFQTFNKSVSDWAKKKYAPDGYNLTETEVSDIMKCGTCCSKGEDKPGQSYLAGDGVFMIDLNTETAYKWGYTIGSWNVFDAETWQEGK